MDKNKIGSKEETSEFIEHPFIRILRDAPPKLYSSFRYRREGNTTNQTEHLPQVPDVISHLKLMRAFAVMKARVFETFDGIGELNEKNWQVFITNAVRRFIIFVSCLKHAVGPFEETEKDEEKRFFTGSLKDNLINHHLGSLLPPLDVLMVWHSFLLNPRTFYDHFMRNDFYKFANIPFPFYTVNLAIDNETFEYNPLEDLRKNYFALLHPFIKGNTTYQEMDLERFDVSKFNMNEYAVDVVCPACKQTLLHGIPYTNDIKTGFADPKMVWKMTAKSCVCDFSTTITHDELRKRQMYSDSMNSALFPGAYRYFSSVLSHKIHKTRSCVAINDRLLAIFNYNVLPKIREHDLTNILRLAIALKNSARPMLLIFRNYLNMNLIHLTISPPHNGKLKILEFSDDLVGMIARQERFVQRMNKLDWLHSPVIKETIQESIIRYQRFFHLLTRFELKNLLVPTLDIDLIWHTHQLSTYYYFKDCHTSLWTSVVDHDDKVEQGRLDDSFEKTCKIYRLRYKEEYSICYCWYCIAVRANSRSTVGKLFKSKVKEDSRTYQSSPLFNNSKGLTHISSHNAIELPMKKAVKLRKNIQNKYANNRSGSGSEVPWAAFSMGYYPWLYVVDPVAPVSLDHAPLYGTGTCTTVNDVGPDSTGVGDAGAAGCGLGNSALCSTSACGGGDSGGGGGCGGGSGGGGGGCGGGCGGCGGG